MSTELMKSLGVKGRGVLPRGRASYFVGRCVLACFTLAMFAPVALSVELAFRTTGQIDKNPLALPARLSFFNFTTAWSQAHLGKAFFESTIVMVVSVVWLVVVGQVTAYFVVRRKDRLAVVVLMYVLLGLVIPYPSRVLPLYEIMTRFHLVGNPIAVMLFEGGSLTPLSVLLYRGFLRRLPIDYEDAAFVDGAGTWSTLRHVVVPMLRPCTAAVATLSGILIWNDFFTPLLLVGGTGAATVPVQIYSFVGQYTAQWGEIFAALTLAALPVVAAFLGLQKYLVAGLGSGLKG